MAGNQELIENVDAEIEKPEEVMPVEHTIEELLISCIEARPTLWDCRLPIKDRSKTIRDRLWMEIFSEFGENPEFSLEFLQKKWRNLRDTYVRLKGEYTTSGSAANKRKKPTVSNVPLPARSLQSPSTSSYAFASPLTSPISMDTGLKVPEGTKKRNNKDNIEGAILDAIEKVNSPIFPQLQLPSSEDINPICRRISEILSVMPQKERTLLEIKLLQCAFEGSKEYL